jgi:hypothetical protein
MASDARQAGPGRWAIALSGMVALAVAMGIGRFAFTPLLPMMLHDGVIDLPGASWLATANYVGYLVGALLCTLQPWIWRRLPALPPVVPTRMVRAGLAATVLLTAAMAAPLAWSWPALRFASGVASAFVFVFTSGWCLAQMARLGVPAMGGLIYIGPGAGIVLSGLLASGMVALHWTAAAGWLLFGALALGLTLAVVRTFRTVTTADAGRVAPSAVPGAAGAAASGAAAAGPGSSAAAVPSSASTAASPTATAPKNLPTGRGEIALLAGAYGIAGFGYIVTATFLPVIARQALPGSPWLDLFWPIFGSGVMLGAIIASRLPPGDNRLLLAACFFVQALGIAVGIWSPSLAGFALGSLLLGLPFTAITFFAMQEIRRLRPLNAPGYMGLATALYGIGQIVGPPMVAFILQRSASPGQGFTWSLEIAAGALVLGALLYLLMARLYPVRR